MPSEISLKQTNQPLREYRPHTVHLTVTSEVVYRVDARTPEQAEEIAREFAEAGEVGEIESTDIQLSDVYQSDDDATGFAS